MEVRLKQNQEMELPDGLPSPRFRAFLAGRRSGRRRLRAFTLLEVLLAVAIAVGMLAVVLFFYTQAANLRVHLLYETARISAARLLLDRLTTELSNARRCDSCQIGLTGGPDHLEFVRLDLPNSSWWTNSPDSTVVSPTSPFRVVRYAALLSSDGTNVSGLTRWEEPLLKRSIEPAEEGELSGTNTVASRRRPVSIDHFRFLRFRYWNGAVWLDSWTGPELPSGIEVSLGAEPLPEETSPDEYPYELFRRVIFLPGHAPDSLETGEDALHLETLSQRPQPHFIGVSQFASTMNRGLSRVQSSYESSLTPSLSPRPTRGEGRGEGHIERFKAGAPFRFDLAALQEGPL